MDREVIMNRIQRIAAAAIVSGAALVPATLAPAHAEPYPWHQPADTSQRADLSTKAQIEHEERLREGSGGHGPDVAETTPDSSTFPWDIVGLAALGAGTLAAAGAVVARQYSRTPSRA